jgi:hypothetical protein
MFLHLHATRLPSVIHRENAYLKQKQDMNNYYESTDLPTRIQIWRTPT